MKREPRTEVASVRLTKAERKRMDELGGPTAALRRALEPPRPTRLKYRVGHKRPRVVWFDGTVGQTWPPVRTAAAS